MTVWGVISELRARSLFKCSLKCTCSGWELFGCLSDVYEELLF